MGIVGIVQPDMTGHGELVNILQSGCTEKGENLSTCICYLLKYRSTTHYDDKKKKGNKHIFSHR